MVSFVVMVETGDGSDRVACTPPRQAAILFKLFGFIERLAEESLVTERNTLLEVGDLVIRIGLKDKSSCRNANSQKPSVVNGQDP